MQHRESSLKKKRIIVSVSVQLKAIFVRPSQLWSRKCYQIRINNFIIINAGNPQLVHSFCGGRHDSLILSGSEDTEWLHELLEASRSHFTSSEPIFPYLVLPSLCHSDVFWLLLPSTWSYISIACLPSHHCNAAGLGEGSPIWYQLTAACLQCSLASPALHVTVPNRMHGSCRARCFTCVLLQVSCCQFSGRFGMYPVCIYILKV